MVRSLYSVQRRAFTRAPQTKLDQVPALKLSNTRDKRPLVIKRDGEDLEIHNTADMTLKPGDYLIIGSGRRTITCVPPSRAHSTRLLTRSSALWQRIVLFWRPSSKELAPATKICASIGAPHSLLMLLLLTVPLIGIKLSLNFVDIITHHVIPTRDLKDDCLASLLAGAAHVTKHWVDRVFELAQLPPESNGLDHTFLLPDTSDYAPPFADESAAWAQPRLWKEDPARETLFEGLRFLIVSDGSMIEQFGANVVKCGGSYDAFSVRDGLDRWDRTIANSLKRAGKPKGNMHAALVVIVDEEDIKPALTRRWDAFVASLHTYAHRVVPFSAELSPRRAGLKYTSSAAVRLAILDRKVKELDCFHDPDTAADSQFIPGTIAEEPSQLAPSTQSTDAPALRRRAPRGATTPAESQATEPPAEQMQPVPAARRGTKRTRAESAAPEPEPEPEEPQPKRVSRRTRAGSAAPEPAPAPPPPPPEPAAEEEEDIFAPPKRPLRTRRTKPTLLTGLDGDPSVVEATQPDPPPARAAAPVPENENEPVFRPLLSLKRRAAGRTQSRGGGFSLRIGDDDEEEDSSQAAADEPPLKKFRALFEGTEDPSTSAGASGHASFAVTQTQPPTTQSQSQRPLAPSVGTSKGTTQLSAVMELDEDGAEVSRELPLTAGTSATGTKRRRDEDGDVEMADAMPPPAAKKRKETQTQASQAAVALSEKDKKGGAKGKTGAVGGVLSAADKNDKVLTALASLKKGKRTEDNFDREFNALRISKPESDHERRAREEDEFFAHFDFEEGLRGKKCIEVREYVLPERQRADGPEREASTGAGRGPLGMWKPAWEGAPNYKKFKKVVGGAATAEARNSGGGRVELVCPEEKDFGMGSSAYSPQTPAVLAH